MDILITGTILLITYLLGPICLSYLLAKLVFGRNFTQKKFFIIAKLTFGAFPLVLSWVLMHSLWLMPGCDYNTYFYVGLGLSVFVIICGNNGISLFLSNLSKNNLNKVLDNTCDCIRKSFINKLILLFLVFITLSFILFSILIPLHENDAVQYYLYAKMFFEQKSLAFYPTVDISTFSDFYAVASHPLGFVGLHYWGLLVHGNSSLGVINYFINVFYVICTYMLFSQVLSKASMQVKALAMLLLISNPTYFINGYLHGIDVIRIYFLLAAVCCLIRLDYKDVKAQIIVAFMAALSMYTHSVNILFTLPFCGLTYLILSKDLMLTVRFGVICLSAFLIMDLYQPVKNYMVLGSFISDNMPVLNIESIGYNNHVFIASELFSYLDKILWGVFAPFTKLKAYALTCYPMVVFLIVMYFSKAVREDVCSRYNNMILVIGILIVFYMAIVILSLLMNMHVFVANNRYYTTIMPFIYILGALVLECNNNKKFINEKSTY